MKQKPNTTTEAELRELAAQGLTWIQIGQRLGICVHKLRMTASALGIRSGYYNCLPAIDQSRLDDYVAKLRRGMTASEIAEGYGISKQAVAQELRKRGLPTTTRAAIRAQNAVEEAS